MRRHRGPVDVRIHWAAVTDGVTGKEQEPAEALDLIELKPVLRSTDLDTVFLHHHRHEVAPVPLPVSLDPANFVEKAPQDVVQKERDKLQELDIALEKLLQQKDTVASM